MAAAHVTPFSGSWYPGEPQRLNDLLDRLFSTSAQRRSAYVLKGGRAFVVPHAGLVYSGNVAAAVYRHLQADQPERVVILGFPHRGAPPGVYVPQLDRYRTPIGDVSVDREACERLVERGPFAWRREDQLCDHSVEIQLPFLRRAVPEARIVPLYVSSLSREERQQAAQTLLELADSSTVFLASSDFTHYGAAFAYQPFPVDRLTSERIRRLDFKFIEAASSLDPEFFIRELRKESATVCGREPIALLLELLRQLDVTDDVFQRTLDYETSGDITGDWSHCVSYAALGYFPWKAFLLSEEDQQLLLESARKTLEHYQATGKAEPIPPSRMTEALHRPAGVFVTLHRHGQLRGCIGRCEPEMPLAELVPRMTLAAALEDPRFAPVGRDETDLELEISVLSPLKLLTDLSRFRVGVDGALLRTNGHSGLLLPQVAEGRKWAAEDFLRALATKAGVSPDVYRDGNTRVYVFRAQIIR